jgi:hypothetical protein
MKESLKLLFTGTGIILFWRGIWNFADTYLLVDYPILSNLTAVAVGASIIILMKHKNI